MRFIRRHPEVLLFSFGSLLFVLGLLNVFTDFLSPGPASGGRDEPAVAGSLAARPAATGPQVGDPIPAYIENRRAVLTKRNASAPKASSSAVISFDSYRKQSEVEQFLAAHKLEPVAAQVRIPLPQFKPEEVRLQGRPLSEALQDSLGPPAVAKLGADLKELEKLIPTVTDREFKEDYEQNARAHREAIELLKSNPSAIFALVVKATNANLAKAATATGVRLVDVPDDAGASAQTHQFFGLVPEDTASAVYGRQPA